MSALEIALIILVGVWTVIFAVIAIAMIIMFLNIRRALKKASNILDRTEEVALKADFPSKVIIASILGFMAKHSFSSIKNILKGRIFRSKAKED